MHDFVLELNSIDYNLNSMRGTLKKRINTEKYLKANESFNSFLIETSFNSDIDMEIRREIDLRYRKSKINSEYKFPRKVGHVKHKSNKLLNKINYEKTKNLMPAHKISKSSVNTLFIDTKCSEKSHSKKVSFISNLISPAKNKPKKECKKVRHYSCRALKLDKILKSKSPKYQNNFIEVFNKEFVSASNKRKSTECLNMIFSPYNSNANLLNTIALMRLKKVYNNVKHLKFY